MARKEPQPVRYLVEWHSVAEVEAACIKVGMKPDDGTGFWDWVEIYDHKSHEVFRDFSAAVARAKEVAPLDCFGGGRVYRQVQVVARDGKRHVIRWDDECFWDGLNGDDQPDEDKPDELCDAA